MRHHRTRMPSIQHVSCNMGILIRIFLMLTFFIFGYRAVEMSNIKKDEIIEKLYNYYREAVADNEPVASRRVFINNVEYQMHVNKLRDVNGLKLHNLVLRTGGQPDVNKTIYISNPLESKMPQAFLSFDEFKQTLTDRVQKQKEEVREGNLKAKLNEVKIHKRKTTTNSRLPRTIYFIRAPDYPDTTNYKQKNGNNNTNVKSEKEIPEAPEIEKIANIAEGYDINDSLHTKSTVTKTTHNIYIYHILPDGTKTKLFRRTTLKGLILGALEKVATDHTIRTAKNDNETSEKTTMTETKPKEEIGTAKDSKEIKAESFVPSKKKTTELVTNADVTETSELETTTLTTMETEMTETVTEEFSTTSMSTRATLGRPAVYIGR